MLFRSCIILIFTYTPAAFLRQNCMDWRKTSPFYTVLSHFLHLFNYFLSKAYSSIVYTDQNSTTLRSELYILENSKSSSVHLVELLPLNISCYIIHFSKIYRTTSTQPLFLPVTKIELYGLEKWISILYSSLPALSIISSV